MRKIGYIELREIIEENKEPGVPYEDSDYYSVCYLLDGKSNTYLHTFTEKNTIILAVSNHEKHNEDGNNLYLIFDLSGRLIKIQAGIEEEGRIYDIWEERK